jgi:hypothetical protein
MILYGDKDEENRPVLQVAMPRAPRIYAPGGTMHVVARCNNREFYFTAQNSGDTILIFWRAYFTSLKGWRDGGITEGRTVTGGFPGPRKGRPHFKSGIRSCTGGEPFERKGTGHLKKGNINLRGDVRAERGLESSIEQRRFYDVAPLIPFFLPHSALSSAEISEVSP